MLADREHDPPARPADLIGQLDAGGRGANDQHTAFGELLGIAIVERGERLDRCRHSLSNGRHAREVASAARQHHAAAAKVAVVGRDVVPLGSRFDGGYRGVGAHRGESPGSAADRPDAERWLFTGLPAKNIILSE